MIETWQSQRGKKDTTPEKSTFRLNDGVGLFAYFTFLSFCFFNARLFLMSGMIVSSIKLFEINKPYIINFCRPLVGS